MSKQLQQMRILSDQTCKLMRLQYGSGSAAECEDILCLLSAVLKCGDCVVGDAQMCCTWGAPRRWARLRLPPLPALPHLMWRRPSDWTPGRDTERMNVVGGQAKKHSDQVL